jgi:hypothetical protein
VGQRMPIFMGEVPKYQVQGDHMHIIWRDIELVLPVGVMLSGMVSAEEAIAKWKLDRTGDDRVVRIGRKRK